MIIMELKCKLMIGGLRARVVVLLHVNRASDILRGHGAAKFR